MSAILSNFQILEDFSFRIGAFKKNDFPEYFSLLLIFHKPFLRSCKVPHKNGPDRFSCFDVYLLQAKKHTDQQAKFIHTGCPTKHDNL